MQRLLPLAAAGSLTAQRRVPDLRLSPDA